MLVNIHTHIHTYHYRESMRATEREIYSKELAQVIMKADKSKICSIGLWYGRPMESRCSSFKAIRQEVVMLQIKSEGSWLENSLFPGEGSDFLF